MSTAAAQAMAGVNLSQFGLTPEIEAAVKSYVLSQFSAEVWKLYGEDQQMTILSIHKKILFLNSSITIKLQDVDTVLEPMLEHFFGPPPAGTPGVPK